MLYNNVPGLAAGSVFEKLIDWKFAFINYFYNFSLRRLMYFNISH